MGLESSESHVPRDVHGAELDSFVVGGLCGGRCPSEVDSGFGLVSLVYHGGVVPSVAPVNILDLAYRLVAQVSCEAPHRVVGPYIGLLENGVRGQLYPVCCCAIRVRP